MAIDSIYHLTITLPTAKRILGQNRSVTCKWVPKQMTLDRMTVNRLEPGKGKAVNELATECELLDHRAF